MGTYKVSTPVIDGGDNSTLKLPFFATRPQPDAFLRFLPEMGGQSKVFKKYLTGPPELVAEVSATSANYDLTDKLEAYRLNGVCEYIVWRVWDNAIDWLILRDGQYERVLPDGNGVVRCEVMPGLWLDSEAMLRRDMPRVLVTLQQGLASPEHAAFVAWLAALIQNS